MKSFRKVMLPVFVVAALFAMGCDDDSGSKNCSTTETTCKDGKVTICVKDAAPEVKDCESKKCNAAGNACEVVVEKCTDDKVSCADGVLTTCVKGSDPVVTDCDPKECNTDKTACAEPTVDNCTETKTSCANGVLTTCVKDAAPVVKDCDPKECNADNTACAEPTVDNCTETKTSCADGVLTTCVKDAAPVVKDCDPKECNTDNSGCKENVITPETCGPSEKFRLTLPVTAGAACDNATQDGACSADKKVWYFCHKSNVIRSQGCDSECSVTENVCGHGGSCKDAYTSEDQTPVVNCSDNSQNSCDATNNKLGKLCLSNSLKTITCKDGFVCNKDSKDFVSCLPESAV